MIDALSLYRRYKQHLCECPSVGLRMDISRMDFDEGFFARMAPGMEKAYQAMTELEAGAVANPDEQRMVGHYWLRAPGMAPDEAIGRQIAETVEKIKEFAAQVHTRQVAPPEYGRFTDVLLIGIGGSALGPQLVADALGTSRDKMEVHFLDNTDPDGFDRTLGGLGSRLKGTLAVTVSKSGGTPETRNGMLEVAAYFASKHLNFARHAVAITSEGSQLDRHALQDGWLARFPMWDWVGGRTSVLSAVGLLPAALQGLDIQGMLDGAAEMDKLTRVADTMKNPAALLALMWHQGTGGKGAKDMVILPYKDRLLLLSRYLQQLVMESLGKEKDLSGHVVHQGIAVYGNKGSTDQHAYVQQLREGVNNFFATFIVVLQDRAAATAKNQIHVESGVTSGDYLSGLWQGTRQALYENGRGSVTITVDKLDAAMLGGLVALYERAVGFYATLVNINAYHQPGVEAGKKAAATVLEVQRKVVGHLQSAGEGQTPEQIADKLAIPQQVETVRHVLEHLAANKRGVGHKGEKFRWKG